MTDWQTILIQRSPRGRWPWAMGTCVCLLFACLKTTTGYAPQVVGALVDQKATYLEYLLNDLPLEPSVKVQIEELLQPVGQREENQWDYRPTKEQMQQSRQSGRQLTRELRDTEKKLQEVLKPEDYRLLESVVNQCQIGSIGRGPNYHAMLRTISPRCPDVEAVRASSQRIADKGDRQLQMIRDQHMEQLVSRLSPEWQQELQPRLEALPTLRQLYAYVESRNSPVHRYRVWVPRDERELEAEEMRELAALPRLLRDSPFQQEWQIPADVWERLIARMSPYSNTQVKDHETLEELQRRTQRARDHLKVELDQFRWLWWIAAARRENWEQGSGDEYSLLIQAVRESDRDPQAKQQCLDLIWQVHQQCTDRLHQSRQQTVDELFQSWPAEQQDDFRRHTPYVYGYRAERAKFWEAVRLGEFPSSK